MLIAMVVLASVAAFYLMGKYGAVSEQHERQDNRVAALAEAKKALIAYAATYIDTHPGEMGFLPCPDTDEGGANPEEGQQDVGACGNLNTNTIGRLPYRSLDIAPQKDEANECLWYAVSGYYKNAPKTEMLNEDTNGMLQISNAAGAVIYGNNPEDRVVAAVIAPGTNLNQDRSGGVANTEQCGGNYTVANYLEGDGVIDNSVLNNNPDQADSFIKAGTNSESGAPAFNDLILTITRDEIWNAVKRRRDYRTRMEDLTQKIANCVVAYGNAGSVKNLPWPSDLDLSATGYRDDTSYADSATPASLLGRLPDLVSNSEAQLDASGSGSGGPPDFGGAVPTDPPSCNQCKKDYDKYLEELAEELAEYRLDIAEANTDYQTCLLDPTKTEPECDAELADELADAKKDYNEELDEIAADELADYQACLVKHTCTTVSGGFVADCTGCQSDYDKAIADAIKKRDKELNGIPGQYTSCIKKAKGDPDDIADCEKEREEDIADANEDYAEDVAEAQALLELCSSVNSCPTGGGSKGIEKMISSCLVTPDFELWQHWKDHFFYVVSGDFSPGSSSAVCAGNCVTVAGTPRAGIVLFSGERQPGVDRNDPIGKDVVGTADTDSRLTIGNYLDGSNAGNYQDAAGNKTYDWFGNDYLYCINPNATAGDPLSSAECPK